MNVLFDIYLLEAVLNGLLLGGLLALLALGLNLVFGVIDLVWICYAELVMVGMYGIWWSYTQAGMPLGLSFIFGIALVALLGAGLHHFVIRPVLQADPVNQLLVTGGVLFFLQAVATVIFGVEFRNMGIRLPVASVGEISISTARLIAFGVALLAIAGTWLLLTRTYVGTAIRAISQDRSIMPLVGVNPSKIYLITSALGGGLAGLAASLLVLQYDVHPAIGMTFGPITFLVCVLGGLGNLIGGFVAAFLLAQFISVGGFYFQIEWGYVIAFVFFILAMFWKPQGILSRRR